MVLSEVDARRAGPRVPPGRSGGLFSDIRLFFLHRPAVRTWIDVSTEENRENYGYRIRQRLGIGTARYSVLNIHKIGIEAPVRYVYEELLEWDGDSSCWPNHVATAERVDGRLEHIRILLFGCRKLPFGLGNGLFGLRFIPLFDLRATRFQRVPESWDLDNARYLIFESSGGYPIGFFAIYVRSSIPAQKEQEQAQLFLVVGFDFYGKENLPATSWINRIWEKIHNRVTANVMNRFKQLCEWRFQRIQGGVEVGARARARGAEHP